MKVVLDEIGIPGCHEWQFLRPCVSHIGRGIQPVFEKEEKAEHKAGRLPLREEIGSQEEWNQPLQHRPTPETERCSEPCEQVVAALMNNKVRAVDKQEAAMRRESIETEPNVEDQPGHHGGTRERLPWFLKDRSQNVQHARLTV